MPPPAQTLGLWVKATSPTAVWAPFFLWGVQMESRLLFPSYGYQWPWGAPGANVVTHGSVIWEVWLPGPLFQFLPLRHGHFKLQWGNTPHLQSNSILVFTPLSGPGAKDLVQGVEPIEMWVGYLLSYFSHNSVPMSTTYMLFLTVLSPKLNSFQLGPLDQWTHPFHW